MVNIDACRGWFERVEEGEEPELNGGELSVPCGAERIRSPTHRTCQGLLNNRQSHWHWHIYDTLEPLISLRRTSSTSEIALSGASDLTAHAPHPLH